MIYIRPFARKVSKYFSGGSSGLSVEVANATTKCKIPRMKRKSLGHAACCDCCSLLKEFFIYFCFAVPSVDETKFASTIGFAKFSMSKQNTQQNAHRFVNHPNDETEKSIFSRCLAISKLNGNLEMAVLEPCYSIKPRLFVLFHLSRSRGLCEPITTPDYTFEAL